MEKKQGLKEYKEQLQFKKVMFGGYDKKDVQMKFDIYAEMVEMYMADQKKEFNAKAESMRAAFEKKLKSAEALMNEMNYNISSLTEENEALVIKQQKMKEAYKEYCENILKQYSSSLCSLSNEFTRIMENVASLQKEIVSKDIYEGLDQALEMKQIPEILEGENDEE